MRENRSTVAESMQESRLSIDEIYARDDDRAAQ